MDQNTDTGSSNIRKIAAVYTDEVSDNKNKRLFSNIHGALDTLMKKCNLHFPEDYELKETKNPFYFPGQQFEVILKGNSIGSLGVVHPAVIRNFNWMHPTVMWELDVVPLEQAFTKSYHKKNWYMHINLLN